MQIINAIQPGGLVLDLGCGQGLLAEEYAKREIRVVGVDNIPPSKGIDSFENFFQQNLEAELNLPYGRDFDCIVLSDVIEHVNDRVKLMKYIRRYLKKEGLLIISAPNIAIWFYRLSLLLGRFEYGPKGILDRTHVHLYTLDSFSRFLRESGYRILNSLYTPIPFELVFSSTGRSLFIDKITHWYHKLALFWPRMFAYQFILKCQFISYESARDEELLKLRDHKM
jgi:SAM-dependent methyltransferase